MSAAALLQTIVSELERADIPFMLTGSMAAAVHGAGRATLDIDVIIEPTAQQLRAFSETEFSVVSRCSLMRFSCGSRRLKTGQRTADQL